MKRALLVSLAVMYVFGSLSAQSLNVTGRWQTNREITGNVWLELTQTGGDVTGTYYPGNRKSGLAGKIEGKMIGNTLTGNFSDIMSRGQVKLRFSDGGKFDGAYILDNPNSNGWRRWTGARIQQ